MKKYRLAINFIDFDESTFFWTDGKKVYFRGYEIKGADIESFEHFSGSWAKDRKNCYSGNMKLQGADPSTFEVMNFTYAKDNSSVWTIGGRVIEADIETFEVCDSGKNSLGFSFRKLDNEQFIRYEIFVPYGFAKDRNTVYYYDFQGKTKIVKNAIAESFVSLNDSYFGYDEKAVFCGAKTIPKANPATWKKLQENYFYSKDESRIYYFNRLIKEADAETFEVVVISNLTGTPLQYAKDKNHYYTNDEICSKEDFEKEINDDIERNEELKEQWKKSTNA